MLGEQLNRVSKTGRQIWEGDGIRNNSYRNNY